MYRTVSDSGWGGVSGARLLTGGTTARHTNHERGSITIRGSRDADLGNRTLVFRRMDRRPFGRIFGRFGIFSDSYVRCILSDSSTCGRTIRHSPIHSKNTAEFPIIICNLATGTDAIIGTDVLGSVLPHTLDIKNGLLFAKGGASLQLHRKDSALSGRVFTVGHSSIPPYSEVVLHCSVRTTGGRALPSSGLLEGLTLFAEDTGLIVGRTLVDPSKWKVPVLVSNFSQETIVVNPFTEVGMITQVTAIHLWRTILYNHRVRPEHYLAIYKIW